MSKLNKSIDLGKNIEKQWQTTSEFYKTSSDFIGGRTIAKEVIIKHNKNVKFTLKKFN